jgi:hypothetical protein
LVYRSGNAPAKRDMLGTLMLSILAGHQLSRTRAHDRCVGEMRQRTGLPPS